MEVLEVRVRPERLRNRQYVLYEITYYHERIPGKPWANKSKRVVWPPAKLANGRGMQFKTRHAARQYYRDWLHIMDAEGGA
jgi:hypothetical protein